MVGAAGRGGDGGDVARDLDVPLAAVLQTVNRPSGWRDTVTPCATIRTSGGTPPPGLRPLAHGEPARSSAFPAPLHRHPTAMTNRTGSRVTVPTITDVLIQTSTVDCRHSWRVQGGTITLTRAELLPALEAAYDPSMPDWPAMVEVDE